MRLIRFKENGKTSLGALCERGVIDLTANGINSNIRSVIADWEIFRLQIEELLADSRLSVRSISELTPAPVTNPSKILCVGLNYISHAEETGGGSPKEPAIFCKMPQCAAGHLEAVPLPPACSKIDYEAELVIIIGSYAYNIGEQEAKKNIFGYTCGNDLSARDAQFRSNQWIIGKSLPKFAPSGPVIVTADELDASDLEITCTVNGELRQAARTSDMTFKPAEIVAYISQFMELFPGDQIYTGTPSGVIIGMPKGSRPWLKEGDEITVSIEGIGSLTNRLKA